MEDLNREKDIQDLCSQVLSIEPEEHYNTGARSCPFCRCGNYSNRAELLDMEHIGNCAYLIAKDLSTK